MRYRIARPVPEGRDEDLRFDIVDPVSSSDQRALALGGFADTEVATNSVLLTLCERAAGRFTLLDVGAGAGAGSLLCASVFGSGRVIAVETSPCRAAIIDRIAAANGLTVEQSLDVFGVGQLGLDGPPHAVRIGPSVDVEPVVNDLHEAWPDELPPIVIVGGRADRRTHDELAAIAADHGSRAYPLTRYPVWRPLGDGWQPTVSEGWLLFAEPWTRRLRARHLVWAGALGACTPDWSDRRPILAETRCAIRGRRTSALLAGAIRRDVRAEAQRLSSLVDPWLPPPRSSVGRMLERVRASARARL